MMLPVRLMRDIGARHPPGEKVRMEEDDVVQTHLLRLLPIIMPATDVLAKNKDLIGRWFEEVSNQGRIRQVLPGVKISVSGIVKSAARTYGIQGIGWSARNHRNRLVKGRPARSKDPINDQSD